MLVEIIVLCLILALNLYMILGLLNSKGLHEKNRTISFAGMLIGIILWVISILITDVYYKELATSLWASRASFAAVAIISIFYIHFSYSFRQKVRTTGDKIFQVLWTTISLIQCVIAMSNLVVESVEIQNSQLVSTFGPQYLPYSLYILLSLLIPSIILYSAFKVEKNSSIKYQILYILVGSIISITSAIGTNLVVPMLGLGEIRYLGPVSLIFFLFFTYYAIARYRFLSLRSILGKTLSILLISLIPYIAFYFTFFLQEKLWGSIFTTEAFLFGYIISIAFITLLTTTYNYINRIVRNTIINPRYNPSKALETYNRNVSQKLTIESISEILQKTIRETINPSDIGLIMEDTENKIIYSDLSNFSKEESDQMSLIIKNIEDITFPYIFEEISADLKSKPFSKELNKTLETLAKKDIAAMFRIKTAPTQVEGLLILGSKPSKKAYTIEDINFMNSLIDVTSMALGRARLHLEVQNFNKDLQKKVTAATKELNKKIKELEEARRKERDLIDVMGHELRTPMSIIKNYFGLFKKILEKVKESFTQTDVEKMQKYKDQIEESIERELKLINILLGATKIEADRLELAKEPVDIIDVIEDAIAGQENTSARKKITIKYEKPQNSNSYPKVWADRVKIQQIMDNLLSNAVKYTNKGQVTISSQIQDDYIQVSVKDTGIGIKKDDIAKLGSKFFRANQYIDNKDEDLQLVRPGGSGLGLYVTYGLVKAHGGDIKVESEVGKGSTFTFSIPRYNGQKSDISTSKEKNLFKKMGLSES